MERWIDRCCGLDVHKATVAACVRLPGLKGKRTQEVRTFGTMTEDLQAPDYAWEIGRIRMRGIPGGLPYLIGRPIL